MAREMSKEEKLKLKSCEMKQRFPLDIGTELTEEEGRIPSQFRIMLKWLTLILVGFRL